MTNSVFESSPNSWSIETIKTSMKSQGLSAGLPLLSSDALRHRRVIFVSSKNRVVERLRFYSEAVSIGSMGNVIKVIFPRPIPVPPETAQKSVVVCPKTIWSFKHDDEQKILDMNGKIIPGF